MRTHKILVGLCLLLCSSIAFADIKTHIPGTHIYCTLPDRYHFPYSKWGNTLYETGGSGLITFEEYLAPGSKKALEETITTVLKSSIKKRESIAGFDVVHAVRDTAYSIYAMKKVGRASILISFSSDKDGYELFDFKWFFSTIEIRLDEPIFGADSKLPFDIKLPVDISPFQILNGEKYTFTVGGVGIKESPITLWVQHYGYTGMKIKDVNKEKQIEYINNANPVLSILKATPTESYESIFENVNVYVTKFRVESGQYSQAISVILYFPGTFQSLYLLTFVSASDDYFSLDQVLDIAKSFKSFE